MADVGDGELVTKFLFSTCRLQPTKHDVRAVVCNAGLASLHPQYEPEAHFISVISGSSVELYIKPMLSFVDDIDIMFHRSDYIAIPAGYPAPPQLPDEFHSHVEVYEIIDSEYPGYVYLNARYLLTDSNDDGTYSAVLNDRHAYLRFSHAADADIHGPAAMVGRMVGRTADSSLPSADFVQCVRCLSWPLQAADWPTRPRTFGWPDSATVDRVVSNGCDVVNVAHRLCRNNEWQGEYQWRLSFSRAEITLLNSWMPVQQIVYHMLRVYVKTERLTGITDSTGTIIMSNYHFKTLMLWASELKPSSWWTENTNVVTICAELLHTLAVWLTDSRCPHYFIRNCNLMNTATNPLRIADQLMSVTQSWLSTWFVNNYILKCAQLCPDNVAWLFDDVSTSLKLHNAASAVASWRRNTALGDKLAVYEYAQYVIQSNASGWSRSMDSYGCFANDLAKLNLRLSDYLTAVAFLNFATKCANRDVDIESMDVLSTICWQSDRRRYPSPISSARLLRQAVKLMKVVVNNSRSTVQLIEIELSKAYLYRALRCKDSDNDSIYCLVNVYLAVLYYSTGQYQTAIDHCTLVTRSQDHSQCSSHAVQGDLLPKINASVHSVFGLAVFYQHIRAAAFHQHRSRHVSVFSTDLFAYYMLVSCLSATECNQLARAVSTSEVQHCYSKNVSDRQQLFIDDLLLLKSLTISSKFRRHFEYQQRSTQNPTDLNASKLVELLQQSAVEHLTIFRQFTAREFGSGCTIVTTDFEAVYAYKRGDYQLCLQLSTQNVRTLLSARRMIDVYTFPEIIQLLDDDIVSLTALTLVVNPGYRELDCVYVGITQLTLSLYLMTQCQLKLRHSATQLAQTLDYIQIAHRRHPADAVLDRLTLKLTKRTTVIHLRHNFEYRILYGRE